MLPTTAFCLASVVILAVYFFVLSELQIHACFELNEQFNDIGPHGSKIIIFNLWFNDDGNMELDFETDPEVSTFLYFSLEEHARIVCVF